MWSSLPFSNNNGKIVEMILEIGLDDGGGETGGNGRIVAVVLQEQDGWMKTAKEE